MLQGEGLATAADLPKGEFTMPSVPDGEGRKDSLVEEFSQTNGDIDFPEEGDMGCGIKVGREMPSHIGGPERGEGGKFGADEGRGG